MPQGYTESPTIFLKYLKLIGLMDTFLMIVLTEYVDDLMLCVELNRETASLTRVSLKGHKVSKEELLTDSQKRKSWLSCFPEQSSS